MGLRDFNDNDILVHPRDVGRITKLLKQNLGYIQGESKHLTKVKEPTRKESLIRSITSHEVIPFIKNVTKEASFLRQHIVDLHTSVNLMTRVKNELIIEDWLNDCIQLKIGKEKIYTLRWENTFLFLCEHFYKEAISIRDLKMYKDMLLYKLCDIHLMILNKQLD